MLDLRDYAAGWERKRRWYAGQGYVEGRDLVWTSEVDGLDAAKVDEVIEAVKARLGTDWRRVCSVDARRLLRVEQEVGDELRGVVQRRPEVAVDPQCDRDSGVVVRLLDRGGERRADCLAPLASIRNPPSLLVGVPNAGTVAYLGRAGSL